MKLPLLEMPDERSELIPWIERQLAGPDLGHLVAQLHVMSPREKTYPSLDELFGPKLNDILQSGLGNISAKQLHLILKHPDLLLDLQERIFIEDAPYWRKILQQHEPVQREPLAKIKRQIMDAIAASQATSATTRPSTGEKPSVAPPAKPNLRVIPTIGRRIRRVIGLPAAFGMSAAAAMLAMIGTVGYYNMTAKPANVAASANWGWLSEDAFRASGQALQYWTRLEVKAAEWLDARPTDPRGVARRLHEFRAGCSNLLLAEHSSINEPDRQWLRERCLAWSNELEGLIRRLEAGEDALIVRGEADQLVARLRDAIRQRATT